MQRRRYGQGWAARTVHAVKCLLTLLLSLVVLTISTTATAAEFDPRLCPDARMAAANAVVALAAPVPDMLSDGREAPPISCTICCQNMPGAATWVNGIALPAAPVGIARTALPGTILATLAPALPLDPPRS